MPGKRRKKRGREGQKEGTGREQSSGASQECLAKEFVSDSPQGTFGSFCVEQEGSMEPASFFFFF